MPSSTVPKTVILKGDPIKKEEQVHAAVSVTPGMLVAFDGTSGNLRAHATAGGNAAPAFAVENSDMGYGIDDAYYGAGHASKPSGWLGDSAQYVVSRPGDELYALLAVGANVAKGAFLESAGNGALRAFTNQANQFRAIVARALEAVNNAAGSAAVRIKVEVV